MREIMALDRMGKCVSLTTHSPPPATRRGGGGCGGGGPGAGVAHAPRPRNRRSFLDRLIHLFSLLGGCSHKLFLGQVNLC